MHIVIHTSHTSFNLDITNPTFHNFNQSSMPDWSYPNKWSPSPNIMNKTEKFITTLHRVSKDATPKSYGQKPYQHLPLYTPFQNQPIKENSDWEKSYEAFLEYTRQNQNLKDSQAHHDFQI